MNQRTCCRFASSRRRTASSPTISRCCAIAGARYSFPNTYSNQAFRVGHIERARHVRVRAERGTQAHRRHQQVRICSPDEPEPNDFRQRDELERSIRKLMDELAEYRRKYEDALRMRDGDRVTLDDLLEKLSRLEVTSFIYRGSLIIALLRRRSRCSSARLRTSKRMWRRSRRRITV